MAEVHRELAAHYELFYVRVDVLPALAAPAYLQGHVHGRDVPIVEVLAHMRDVVRLRLVAVLDVGAKPVLYKVFEYPLRLARTASEEVTQGLDAPVQVHAAKSFLHV